MIRAVLRQFLEDQYPGVRRRVGLLVGLHQRDGSLDLVRHELVAERSPADLSYVPKRVRRGEHEVDVVVRELVPDVVVEAVQMALRVGGLYFFPRHLQEVVWLV